MEYHIQQLTFVVFWWMLLPFCCCATEEICEGNSTKTLVMCSNGRYYGKEVYLDTRIFLDTHHFCYCTVRFGGTLDLKPTFMGDVNCGTILSVQNAVGGTLKQFTCKVDDQLSVTGSTLFLKMLGIGTLKSCIKLKSEENFNTTCYITSYIPPELTTQTEAAVTSPTTVTSQSLDVTSDQEETTSLSNRVNVTDDDVTSSILDTSTALPLSAGGVDETFILILTACGLGFLALLSVVTLIVCKCVRHMRTTRQREREDSSYDITMSPNVQKIAARRLIDLDDELVSADNPVYVRHSNGVLKQDRRAEPNIGYSTQQLPTTIPHLAEPSSAPEVKGTRSRKGRDTSNTLRISTIPSTESSSASTEAEVRRTRSRVGRGITPPPVFPTSTPLSARETDSDSDSNGLNHADIDHSGFIMSSKDVVQPEAVEYTTITVVKSDANQSNG